MRTHVLPRVHQALLILFILQSSVVCENTDDWVEKKPPGEESIPIGRSGSHHHYHNNHLQKGYPQVGPPGRAAPPQLQDPAYMAKVQALMEQIKAKKPQALERAKSYLPKSYRMPETVTNLWNKYGWGRKDAEKQPQAPPQPLARSGSRLSRQNAFWKKEGIHIDPLPVQPKSRDVPLQWQDENEAGISVSNEGERDQPAPHQEWDRPQPIAEAQPQVQYLPDPIPPQQYAPPVQEEPIPYADQGPNPPSAEQYVHAPVYDYHEQENAYLGQDYGHPGTPEHHEEIENVQPQPQIIPPPDYGTQQDYPAQADKPAYEPAPNDQNFDRHEVQTQQADPGQYANNDDIDDPQTYDPSMNLANPPPSYETPKAENESPKPAYEPPKPAYEPPKPAYEPPMPAYEPPKPAYETPKPYETPETRLLNDLNRPYAAAPVGELNSQSWRPPSPANDYGFRTTPHAEPPPEYAYGSGGGYGGGYGSYGSGYGGYGSGIGGYSRGSSGYSNSYSGYKQPDDFLAHLQALLDEPEVGY